MPHTTAFARNQWYVAAYGREVGRGAARPDDPAASRSSSTAPRTTATPVALADRCVHRRFPLSEPAGSTATGSSAATTASPTTRPAPACTCPARSASRAPPGSPPTRSSSRTRWSGCGSATRRSPTRQTIPRAPCTWTRPGWTTVRGMEPIDADYGLLVDNLLDLSHETYLHGGYIGTPEVAETPITTEVDEGAGIVRVSRHMDDAECPPFYAKSTGIEGRITRWQDIEYHAAVPVSAAQPHRPGRRAARGRTAATRTPSTSRSCTRSPRRPTARSYDFWAVSRDFAHGRRRGHRRSCAGNNHTVVMQDVDALNLLQQDARHRARRLPGAEHQHRHRRPGRPPHPRPAGRGGRRSPVEKVQ